MDNRAFLYVLLSEHYHMVIIFRTRLQAYSTVTDFARFLGLSMSQPRLSAT